MINKIRLGISNFIKRNKEKIIDLGKKIIIVAMVIAFATIILSSLSMVNDTKNDSDMASIYKPTQTIISGQDVTKEQYEEDKSLVNKFLESCNSGKVEDAYNLLSNECKEEKYPTIEEFREYYYDYIFDKKRECNLQAWVKNSSYIVYKVRYTNDMLATGTYDEGNVYEDYITLNRRDNIEKISIGSFIDAETCNITTNTNGIEATVVSKKTYISDEEYEVYIKNNTEAPVLLDDLQSNLSIVLIASGTEYVAYTNKLFMSNLLIQPGETNRITVRFLKNIASNKTSDNIKFLKVIKDYDAYMLNKEEYNNFIEIKIKVEE